MRTGDFEDNGCIVRIGVQEGFDYDNPDNQRVIGQFGLYITFYGIWWFIGPDGYLWHYPADVEVQRQWRENCERRYNIAIWTKTTLTDYADKDDAWYVWVHKTNNRARCLLQAKYDRVLNRVSLVKLPE